MRDAYFGATHFPALLISFSDEVSPVIGSSNLDRKDGLFARIAAFVKQFGEICCAPHNLKRRSDFTTG